MGIKKFISETIKDYKEKGKKKKELDSIKREAYYEEMKIQNGKMGKKQAQIEAEMRENAFRSKLRAKSEKKELQYAGVQKGGKQIDYFGLNRAFPQEIKII